MSKRKKQFEDVVTDTALRNLRAAQTRFGRGPTEGPPPGEVCKSACQSIATHLANDGFSYARSKATLTRRVGQFRFWIHFQSSHNNVRGELVVIWIHAGVGSTALQTWRSSNPSLMRMSDLVAGGQIGNLVKDHSWMEWNVASETDREDEIANAVGTIRAIAFPYFAMFDNLVDLRARLVAEDVPSMWLACAFDFLMCFGTWDEAFALAQRVFLGNVQVRERYTASLARYRQFGVPPHLLTAQGDALAAATIVLKFPNLTA